jgi:hypothetical protein
MDKARLVARAREADRLLNGDVFAEVMAAARSSFMEEWVTAEKLEHREMCHAKITGLEEVQRQLRRIIGEGEHASRTPDER